jgi:catechol 2,3-dioxygenase-like lactoylglutathione lyase family enzyme
MRIRDRLWQKAPVRAGSARAALCPVARLTHACVITDDVRRLRAFYADVLAMEPTRMHDDYVEFATAGGALSLYARSKLEPYAPGATSSRSNRSVMLEFEVADVDAEYARLRSRPIEWVKTPSTQPWGNRSIYLRDPDGNLVNLYTKVGADADRPAT